MLSRQWSAVHVTGRAVSRELERMFDAGMAVAAQRLERPVEEQLGVAEVTADMIDSRRTGMPAKPCTDPAPRLVRQLQPAQFVPLAGLVVAVWCHGRDACSSS